jgi:hypothetical protein
MIHERLMVVTRFNRRWATVTTVSSEALALGTAPVAAVMTSDPPSSDNSAREVLVR